MSRRGRSRWAGIFGAAVTIAGGWGLTVSGRRSSASAGRVRSGRFQDASAWAADRPSGAIAGRLIVKYADSVTACAHCVFAQHGAFARVTTDGSDSLDRLHARLRVRAIRPLFRDEREEHASRATAAGLEPVGALRARWEQKIQIVRSRYARRSYRAPPGAATPELFHVYVLELPEEAPVEEAADAYRRDPHVIYAQAAHHVRASLVPNDPYYSSSGSWGQSYADLWGLKKLQASQAWDLTQGEGMVVAVVDTGLDGSHPDIAANAWANPGETANGVDDDHNGYIDDLRGWDMTTCADFTDTGCASPKPRGNDTQDRYGHGTHVSGTIAAVGNNSEGVIGVAPKARVMPVKGLNDHGDGSSDDLASAIVYAVDNGADVINNSWACVDPCPSDPVSEDAVRTAYSLGAVVVFAAGNASKDVADYSPQNMTSPKPIVVAASAQDDTPTFFSNTGALLDVCAPGGGTTTGPPSYQPYRNILSLKASVCGSCDSNLVVGTRYYRQAGTSMAAPHAAGLAALIAAFRPTLSNEQIRQVMRETADDIAGAGFDTQTGAGRINAYRALTEGLGSPPVLSPIGPKAATVGGRLQVTVSASDPDGDALTYSAAPLPSGATFDPATRTFDWTPAASQVGSANVTFVVIDATGLRDSETVTITVTGEGITAFQESGGQVVVEAEHAAQRIARSSHAWNAQTAAGGYAGSGYLEAQPNNGTTINTGYASTSPEALFYIQFATPGTYAVWIRGYGMSGSDDSLHAGIDAATPASADRITGFPASWTWSRATMDGVNATLVVGQAGLHTLHLWMREDGMRADRIVLTTNGAFSPSGVGPSESAQVLLPPDTTPPAISGVIVSGIASTQATISWITDEPASSEVVYGTDTGYGSSSGLKTERVISHAATLTGLASSTTYHFRARSLDAFGNLAVSPDATFTTAAASVAEFIESGGLLVIEAEHMDQKIARSSHDWTLQSALGGYAGSGYLEAQPNTGVNQDTGYVTASPELIYRVRIATPGTYEVWLRGYGASGTDDSAHAGLDGVGPASADRLSGFLASWTWSHATMDGVNATLTLGAGSHTLHLWMREDGFRVDRLLLRLPSAGSPPSGSGPAESPRSPSEKEAQAGQRGEVARQAAVAEIQRAKALAEQRRLEAEEVVPREIGKRKIEIDAEAEAQKRRMTAKGEADAILSVRTAEAAGIQKVLDAKAEGYGALVEAAKKDPQAAATLLMVEKLEEIVRLQTEMIKNIQIDKITVWDGGHSEKGSATANFMSSLINTLPPLHEVARMAGVNLPDYLGRVAQSGQQPGTAPKPEEPEGEGNGNS